MYKLVLLFYVFLKIGLFSFGGGYAMLPMIYQEIKNFGFMPAREFSNIVALSQMTPGPIAVNAATYVGYKYAGFWGAIFATIGVSLPSFAIIILISAFFYKFKSSKPIQAVLDGIRPVTVGLIAAAVMFFSKTSIFDEKLFSPEGLKNPAGLINIPALLICMAVLLCSVKFKIGPITLTVLGGIIGIFIL